MKIITADQIRHDHVITTESSPAPDGKVALNKINLPEAGGGGVPPVSSSRGDANRVNIAVTKGDDDGVARFCQMTRGVA